MRGESDTGLDIHNVGWGWGTHDLSPIWPAAIPKKHVSIDWDRSTQVPSKFLPDLEREKKIWAWVENLEHHQNSSPPFPSSVFSSLNKQTLSSYSSNDSNDVFIILIKITILPLINELTLNCKIRCLETHFARTNSWWHTTYIEKL